MRLLALFCCAVAVQAQVLAPQVKALLGAGDFASAQTALTKYRQARGVTPEYLEAFSWIGRTELARKHYPQALANAAEVHQACIQALSKRALDADSSLPTALGASIEVQGQALAGQGKRDAAVEFLRSEEARWHATSIRARIQKNLNLLSLEGKPAPPLDTAALLTAAHPSRSGKPILLFFWAHWCIDCKQEVAVIQQVQKTFGPKGLVVVAPTQTYGYVAGGAEASPQIETPYIRQIRSQYYAGLGNVEMPLSNENFGRYGVSTTPTLVLVDAGGIVRMYHPGRMTFPELSARIAPLIAHPGP